MGSFERLPGAAGLGARSPATSPGRWGFLAPQRRMAQPRRVAAVPVAGRARDRRCGRPRPASSVDGVLALDVVALKDLLQATGPVHLPDGTTMTADQVLGDVMLRQYLGLVGYPDQTTRRDRLGEIARGALANLEPGRLARRRPRRPAAGRGAGPPPPGLVGARRRSRPAGPRPGSAAWSPPDAVLVGLHNRGGNKLDQFINIQGSVQTAGGREPDARRRAGT